MSKTLENPAFNRGRIIFDKENLHSQFGLKQESKESSDHL